MTERLLGARTLHPRLRPSKERHAAFGGFVILEWPSVPLCLQEQTPMESMVRMESQVFGMLLDQPFAQVGLLHGSTQCES